jgi:hypothetical protein
MIRVQVGRLALDQQKTIRWLEKQMFQAVKPIGQKE